MFSALKLQLRNSAIGSLYAVNYYRQPKFISAVSLKMSPKRICSNLSYTKPQKNAVKATVGKGENCCKDTEEMTLQQMKTRLSGVAAKGSEHGFVTDLKGTVDDEGSSGQNKVIDEKMAGITKTYSKRKAEPQGNILLSNMDSNTSGVQTRKRRAKQSSVDATDLKTLQSASELEMIIESVETKEKTSLRGKRKALAKVTTSTKVITNVDPPIEEPWTVLAHKKPQKEWIAYNPKTMRPPPIDNNTGSVKLMSWNVNGLRALLKLESFSALQLALRENFDVLCLQETKLQEKDVEAIRQTLLEGFDHSYWSCSVSKLGYSGTAIISRIKPISVRYGLGVTDHDSEGRLVTVEFDNFYLLNSYVPNSGDGLKRLPYRITQWDSSLSSYMKDLERTKPVILTGDLNCAHQEIDIFNPAGNKRSAGFTEEERKSFQENFLDKGFVDTFRNQHPGVVGYTYWGYRHGGRKTNKGWRLDYFLVSESIADKVYDSYIMPDIGGSDHCPIGIVLQL